MDEGARKWMLKYCHRNYWRVEYYMELEDLISEGFRCYASTKARYQDRAEEFGNIPVTEPKHLMALFKRRMACRMTDLSKYRTKISAEIPFDDDPFLNPTGYDSHIVSEAPEPLRMILRMITSDNNIERLREPYRIMLNGRKETLNDRLCAMANLDPSQVFIPQMLKNYLNPPRRKHSSPIPAPKVEIDDIQKRLRRCGCTAAQIQTHIQGLMKIQQKMAHS